MQNRRIGPDGAIAREIIDTRKRVESLESRPAGDIYFQSATTRDPLTGVEIVIGQLADGSYGIDPFVGDVTPPPVATTPIVSAQPSLITVGWDGAFVADEAKPRDFLQLNVIGHKIEDGVTVYTAPVGVVRRELAAAYLNLDIIPEGETWQFSFQSEDLNGNKSAFSARSASVTMEGILSTKLVDDKIQELKDKDTELSNTAAATQDTLADAQALANALLAKGQNLVINGDFDAPLVSGKPVTGWSALTLSSVEVSASAARTGTQYLRAAPTSSTALAYSSDVTSASGRTYRAEYWVKLGQTAAVTDATATVGFYFTTTKLDGTLNTSPQADTTISVASLTTTGWTRVSKDYTVTQAVSKIKFGPRLTGNGNVYFIDSFKVTDVTDALAAQQKADSAFANAQQAADAAGTAQTAADGRSRNWYQDDAPAGVSHKSGDTWFDTNDGNRIYSWSTATSAWIDRQDTAIAAAATAASGAKTTADGKSTSYWGPTAPTGGVYKSGDLFLNTAEGNKMYLYNTSGGVTGWKPFQDAAISIANQAATGAQATADGKNKSFYEPVAPTNVPAGTLKKGDLWFNTAVGQGNRLSTWDGSAWQTTQDMAATMVEVAKKGRTFTGGTEPALEFRNATNIWIDTSLGDAFAITKRWDSTLNAGVGGWTPVTDKAIAQAVTDAGLDAKAKADASYAAAINAQGFSRNPSFDTWTSSVPANYSLYGTAGSVVKETSIFKRGPYALRFSTPDTATQVGLNLAGGATLDLPNLEFYTVELEFYLVSGTLDGAGVRIDWTGLSPASGAPVYLPSEAPGAATGTWHRISRVVQRPTAATGTWTSTRGYLMGNYSGFSGFGGAGAAKELIFDWFNIRPSTAEEILSYKAPTSAQITSLNNSVTATQLAANGKNKVHYDTVNATGTADADGVPFINGDTWYKRDTASPFSILAQWEYVSGAWVSRKLNGANFTEVDAGTITVGFLRGQNLSATAIDGKTVTGATIQTNSAAASGIKLTPTELAGYDASGQKNFSLTTGGTLAVRGTIQSGSTISGANLSASGIYTNALPQRGVKIMDTGINAWSATGTPTFILDAATGQVEVPGLKASSITGSMIAGQTISAANLLVSDLTNLVTNGTGDLGSGVGWGNGLIYDTSDTPSEVTGVFKSTAGQGTFNPPSILFNVDPNTEYTTEVWLKASLPNSRIYIELRDQAGAHGTAGILKGTPDVSQGIYVLQNFIVPTVWTKYVVKSTTTATATKLKIGGIFFNHTNGTERNAVVSMAISVRRRLAGNLIVDGAITTDHMSSNSIDAKVIATGTLTGDKIEAGAITAEKLTVGIGTNLIPDPGFLSSGVTALRQAASTVGLNVVANATTDNLDLTTTTTGTFYFRATGVTQTGAVYRDWIPVKPGERYMFSVVITLPTGMTGDVRLTGRQKDGVNTSTSFALEPLNDDVPAVLSPFPLLVAGTNTINYSAKVPANAYWMLPEIRLASAIGTATIEPNAMSLRRRSTGELIVDGSITTSHMKVGTIDGGIISANTLTGGQVVANTISSGNLLVTSQDNLIENGGFEYGLTSWTSTPASFTLDTVNGRNSGQALKVTGITARVIGSITNPYFSIENDDSYRISGWVKTTATSGHRAEICIYYYDANKTFVTNTNYNIDPTGNPDPTGVADPAVGIPLDNTWRYFSKLIKPPTGTYAYGRIRLNSTMTAASATMWFDDISVVRATNGTLIVDGSIQANHITAGAIDATKLSANAVTASAISGKSITADKLIISSSNNLLIEPDFSLNGISWTTTPTTGYISINQTAGRGATPALRFTGTTSVLNSYNLIAKGPDVTNKIAVDSDNRFRASFWVKSTEALPVNAVKLAMRRYTTGTAQTAITMVGNNAVLVPNQWTQFQAVSPTLPAGTNGVGSIIALDFYLIVDNLTTGGITDIDAVSVTRAADGNLVVDGDITASKLDANIVLATNIIAGDPNGIHASMEPGGFKVYAPDPGGGPAKEVVRLGVAATDDYFAITKSTGDLAASISAEGVMYALDMNASRALFYKGDELQTLLDDKPRGVVAAAYRDTSSAINGGTTNGDIPYLRLEAFMEVGRVYKISTSPLRISRDAGASVTVGIKYNSTGNATTPALATVSSGNLTQSIVWDEANAPMMQELFALTTGTSRWVSFLIWLGAVGGNAGFRPASGYPARLIIEDVGPNRNTIGSGVSVDGNATPPAAKNTYTKQYNALGSSSYQGNGTVYSFDAGRMYQGLSPAGYGNMKSIAYYPSFTGDLSGAIVNNIRVYFMFDHWYYNSGGTARITLHGQSGLPATFPVTYGTPAVSSGGWPKPGDRWVTIPSSYYGGFVNGTYKGVALEGDSTYGTYGIAQRPVIEISYTK